jgi:hypothetical protein
VLRATVAALYIAGRSTLTTVVTSNQFSTGDRGATVVFIAGPAFTFTSNSVESGMANSQQVMEFENNPPGAKVSSNNFNIIGGWTAGTALQVHSDYAVISNNRVFNYGVGATAGIGIQNLGWSDPTTNKFTSNNVRCFATPFSGVSGSTNVILPCPWP